LKILRPDYGMWMVTPEVHAVGDAGWSGMILTRQVEWEVGVGGCGALKEKGRRLAPPAAATLGFGDCVPSRMYRRLEMT